jgi:hypothetical protein
MSQQHLEHVEARAARVRLFFLNAKDYSKLTPDELRDTFNGMFDRLRDVVAMFDDVQAALLEKQHELEQAMLKLWIMSGVSATLGACCLWFATQLFNRIK